MNANLSDPAARVGLAALYRDTLFNDVLPFWLRHGLDREHGGILTCLDRDGSVFDTDKSVWFQGRAAWMFATVANEATVAQASSAAPLLAASRSCIKFLRGHCAAPDGKDRKSTRLNSSH